MNCEKHSHNAAVAQCNLCGAGVCSDCAQATAEAKESYGTLCTSCYKEKIRETGAYYRNKKEKARKSFLVSVVLFIIGIIVMIVGGIMLLTQSGSSESSMGGAEYVFVMVGGYVLLGALPGINEWRQATADHEEYERKHGVKYVVTDSGDVKRDTDIWTKVFRVAFKLMFGPISTIVMWFGFIAIQRECEQTLANLKKELDYIDTL